MPATPVAVEMGVKGDLALLQQPAGAHRPQVFVKHLLCARCLPPSPRPHSSARGSSPLPVAERELLRRPQAGLDDLGMLGWGHPRSTAP